MMEAALLARHWYLLTLLLVALFVAACLYPPWAAYHPSDPGLVVERLGLSGFWSPPEPVVRTNSPVAVNWKLLYVELAVIGFFAAATLALAKLFARET
jgi:hypothetical protein